MLMLSTGLRRAEVLPRYCPQRAGRRREEPATRSSCATEAVNLLWPSPLERVSQYHDPEIVVPNSVN